MGKCLVSDLIGGSETDDARGTWPRDTGGLDFLRT